MHPILISQALDNLTPPPQLAANRTAQQDAVAHAEEVKAAFTDFFGKTFYSQMIKAMRSTQEKPAYFHGGQAEDIFRSQLDQQLVDEMSKATAESFAEPMFEHQFPELAARLERAEREQAERDQVDLDPGRPDLPLRGVRPVADRADGLRQLETLRRR